MSPTPHSNDPRDNAGEFVLGKDGKPLVDRYGRPIRRRSSERPAERSAPRRDEPGHTVFEPRPAEYEPRRAPQHPPRTPQRPPQSKPAREEQPMPVQISKRREKRPRARRQAKRPGCGTILALIVVLAIASVFITDARLSLSLIHI